LILAHNLLTEVPANVFSHLTLLNSLELEGNRITHVDKDAFAGLEGEYLATSNSLHYDIGPASCTEPPTAAIYKCNLIKNPTRVNVCAGKTNLYKSLLPFQELIISLQLQFSMEKRFAYTCRRLIIKINEMKIRLHALMQCFRLMAPT
jgi:Leucine rich repeat